MIKRISVALFALIILLLPAASMLSPYKSISEQENRTLTPFPAVSFDEITSKRFMHSFDNFVSDHIALRDGWIAMKAELSTMIGKRDNNGVYLGCGCLIQNLDPPVDRIYKANVNAINTFAKRSGKPTYLMVAPTATEITHAKLPAFATTYDQAGFIANIGKQLQDVTLINPIPALTKHDNQYIYYRTDHHWTSLGAYYAYAGAGDALGYTPLPLSSFTVEHATDSFNGTLYSKSGYRSIRPDVIDFYTPKARSPLESLIIGTGDSAKTYNSIYFRDMLKVKDKYSTFFDGNQAYEDIRMCGGSKSLLVLKDSYAHSLVPFLMNHYRRITMIDLRVPAQDLDKTVNIKDYDQVLFLYNVDTFGSDRTIQTIN